MVYPQDDLDVSFGLSPKFMLRIWHKGDWPGGTW